MTVKEFIGTLESSDRLRIIEDGAEVYVGYLAAFKPFADHEMEYVGMTDKNGQPIAKVNYGTSGKPERTLLGRTVVLCDYVASYSAALAKDTIFAFLFNFKDYVLNTNYSMGVKKYEDNDTDDQITKGIMLVDGKVVDKNSLVVVKKIEAV